MSRITEGRYRSTPDGSIYDSWGGYYIDRELWQRRMDEGRSDRADHDFVLGGAVAEAVPAQYHRVYAKCSRCGETRKVFFGVSMTVLNSEWCIPQPNPVVSWWRRLFNRKDER